MKTIGVVHLKALPGSPSYENNLSEIYKSALEDSTALQNGGVDSIIIENFGDIPFAKNSISKLTLAHFTNIAKELSDEFTKADAFIFCAPEYNGGLPPILTNAITWISITTNNWRDCFSGKIALIGTNSGGDGLRFLASFRSQLEYLGTIVVPKTISVNDKKEFNQDSAKRSLQSLIDLL